MKKYIIGIVAVALTLQSCKDFEKINVDPNNPAIVPAEMLLPSIISGGVSTMTNSGTRAGQYVQHLAYLGGTSESDGRYNLTGASWREEWNGAMRLIKDVNQLKLIGENANQPQYVALAYINKVYILSLMTDAFGDIPYDEAGMGNVDGLEFPAYQAQEQVYMRMLEDLETANQLLSQLPAGTTISRDILYNGNPALWRKFANSLKVRILMRQSAKKNVAEDIEHIFFNPERYPVFNSTDEEARLVYNNSSNFYRWYIQNPPADGSGVNFGDNSRVSVTLVDLLKNSDDPRLSIYVAPTRNSYQANRESSSEPLVYRGQQAGLSATEQTALYTQTQTNEGDYSVIGRRIRQDNRAFLMTYAELMLLKAEAMHSGMRINGDVSEVYKQAVNASFDKWPQVGSQTPSQAPYIDQSMRDAYWANPANNFQAARGLEQIAKQYYVDSFLNGFEGWASWRRTGIPQIQPGPSVLSQIPVRYVYSDNEQNNPSLIEWVGGNMPDHNDKVWFQP